jgi:hypothetical protein
MILVDLTDQLCAPKVVILTNHPVALNANGARCGTASVPLMNGSGASRLCKEVAQEGKQETFLTQE